MSIAFFTGLAGLAEELSAKADAIVERWDVAEQLTARWVAEQTDLLGMLREHLQALPPAVAAALAAGSRETTTHFAWRLVDGAAAPYSFWLHEYKPQRDWWAGYANTVHNHRYHFCTTVLSGGFQHERYDVDLDPSGELVRAITRRGSQMWRPGPVRAITADQFHRLPWADDGTLTFLVKSRPVRDWSVSVDPVTMVSRRHVPVEQRIHDLGSRI
jgi:hypothetical protein